MELLLLPSYAYVPFNELLPSQGAYVSSLRILLLFNPVTFAMHLPQR